MAPSLNERIKSPLTSFKIPLSPLAAPTPASSIKASQSATSLLVPISFFCFSVASVAPLSGMDQPQASLGLLDPGSTSGLWPLA
ncbi:hypothetical protein Q8A67_021702 [Cirrhinus molitorella]|uniref:Uncharacterized protein n=1 Tax=Cirrhinus molitorella TaxID=172907 RepID=A0AA88PAC4_9TELE|nr:hypothetical protein Q8A67_021702 [Cirrhinus molitorella]